ncbi:dephospho-CoA kinase [Candidatus Saccharibacteria bacterium]|nr:dephospho-CoA kinase [Candidatus Saccharibacteria bacterium]
MQALDEANLEHTPENETMMRDQLRREHGEDVVIRSVIDQIHGLINAGQRVIIADGLGSWTAYRALKHEFPGEVKFIALLTSRHIRHHRLVNRLERPLTEQQTTDRDINEIERLNKGGVIAMADYFITNNSSFDNLYASIDALELL